MREELENKLAEQFSFMRRGKCLEEQQQEGSVGDLYSAFGCEFDDGWYQMMVDMCTEIMAVYEKAGKPVDIVVDQVKEKYGELCFYYHTEAENIEASAAVDELHRQVAKIVEKYEDKSSTICEFCGQQGKLRENRAWILTLCDQCNEENP